MHHLVRVARTTPVSYLALSALLFPMPFLAGCSSSNVSDAYKPAAPITAWDDTEYASVLAEVVTPNGLVRYQLFRDNTNGVRDRLFRHIGKINAASPDNRPELFPTEADKLAYWINAYNAVCLYRVIQRGYPGNMLASVPPAAIYFTDTTSIGGKSMSLDTLEKSRVLSVGDPRVHFALNCASYSCPPLRREPFSGPKLEAQLADQGRLYLSDPRAVRAEGGDTVGLNSIFTDYYGSDFTRWYEKKFGKKGSVLDALKQFAAPDSPVQRATKFKGIGYDWDRNDANRQ
jgi:hypothetical protein